MRRAERSSSSAVMTRTASVKVRGRGGSLGAVTLPTSRGTDTWAGRGCRT